MPFRSHLFYWLVWRGQIFITAVVGFVVTSWLCGIAHNLQALVFFFFPCIARLHRAGPLFPCPKPVGFPPQKNGCAGLMVMTVVCSCIGADFGGWISDNWHWGWIFLYQYPDQDFDISWKQLGQKLKSSGRQSVCRAVMTVGIGAAQMMLDRGKEFSWFASGDYRFLEYRFGIPDIFVLGAG